MVKTEERARRILPGVRPDVAAIRTDSALTTLNRPLEDDFCSLYATLVNALTDLALEEDAYVQAPGRGWVVTETFSRTFGAGVLGLFDMAAWRVLTLGKKPGSELDFSHEMRQFRKHVIEQATRRGQPMAVLGREHWKVAVSILRLPKMIGCAHIAGRPQVGRMAAIVARQAPSITPAQKAAKGQ